MSSTIVRWRFSPANTRSLRLLACAAVGLTVGPVVGLVTLLSTVFVARGGSGVVIVAPLVALVVGSGRALLALASDDVPAPLHDDTRALSRRWLVGSVVVGAVLGYTGLRWTDVGVALPLGSAVAGFGLLAVGAGLRSEGVVDLGAGTVEYVDDAVLLDAVRRVRSLRFGRFVLVIVGYHAGRVWPSTPRLLVLSADALEALESSGSSRPDVPDDTSRVATRPAPTAVRVVAAALGLACLAAGPVLWLALPPDGGRLLAGCLGLFGLLFGGLFLRYAVLA